MKTSTTKKKPTRAVKAKKSKKVSKRIVNKQVLELRLYIAGNTTKSLAALENLKIICLLHLKGRYKIEVIDLLLNPQLAKGDEIFAIPTLVRKLPVPIKKIIGDLSDMEKVMVGLNIRELK